MSSNDVDNYIFPRESLSYNRQQKHSLHTQAFRTSTAHVCAATNHVPATNRVPRTSCAGALFEVYSGCPF